MKRLKNKLQSRRGASMLMALLLFLVAAMVSAVIVAAAVSAQTRVRADRAQQQTYLTVSSAAELLRDSVQNGSGNYQTRTVTLYYDPEKQLVYQHVSNDTEPATGDFAFLMNEAIRQVKLGSNLTYHRTFTIRAKPADTAERVYADVTGELYLTCQPEDENTTAYTLTVWFTGGTDAHKCRMRLTMVGSETRRVLTTEDGLYYKEVVTTDFIWSDASLAREDGT